MGKVIKYNGIDIFSGQPTPFFSKSAEYIDVGERWGQVESWEIVGNLTGCGMKDLIYEKDKLLSNFTSAFGEINIADEFILNPIEITDIKVDDSDYIGFLPYSISFKYYPADSFTGSNHSGFYGVIDPTDEISYKETEDGLLTMERTISAKGVVTNYGDKNSAINNVKNFISYRSGIIIKAFLIKNYFTNQPCSSFQLNSSKESINRLTNDGTLSQTFRSDLTAGQSQNIIHRYTIDENFELGEENFVTYNGTIECGMDSSLATVKTVYDNFKATIPHKYIKNEQITEDNYANKMEYTAVFYTGSGSRQDIEDDYNIDISESPDSSLINCKINGNLTAKLGTAVEKEAIIREYLDTVKNSNYHFSIINELYSDFYTKRNGGAINKPASVGLNSVAIDTSYEFSKEKNTATYSASFNDRYIPAALAGCKSVDINQDINYSVELRALKEHYKGGKYVCQNLGASSREAISINISRIGITGSYKDKNKPIIDFMKNEMKKISFCDSDTSSTRIYTSPEYSKDESSKTESFALGKEENVKFSKRFDFP